MSDSFGAGEFEETSSTSESISCCCCCCSTSLESVRVMGEESAALSLELANAIGEPLSLGSELGEEEYEVAEPEAVSASA